MRLIDHAHYGDFALGPKTVIVVICWGWGWVRVLRFELKD